MDAQSELARAKWLLFGAVLFLVSGCISYDEFVYLIFGRKTQASVTGVSEVTRTRRFGLSKNKVLMVDYSFAEPDGTRRTGSDAVPIDWPRPEGSKVEVQYTRGADGSSRLAGHVNWFGLIFFGVSFASVCVFGYRLWREASEATSGSTSKRRF
jgi:hypothetical protein